MDVAFLEIVVLVDRKSNRNRVYVFPSYFMLFYDGFLGSSAVFGVDGGGEIPFYVAGATGEGDVIKIDDLGVLDLA